MFLTRLSSVKSLRTMTLLASARKHLKVDAFIQQTDDAHGSEYTCPADNRRPAVSGFSGSAGTAAFTKTEAALWTDGRYFLQASQELDSDWTMMKDGLPETMSIPEWLLTKVPEGGVIGCDGLCTRFNAFESMKKEFAAQNRTLKGLSPFSSIFLLSPFSNRQPDRRWLDGSSCKTRQSTRDYGR